MSPKTTKTRYRAGNAGGVGALIAGAVGYPAKIVVTFEVGDEAEFKKLRAEGFLGECCRRGSVEVKKSRKRRP